MLYHVDFHIEYPVSMSQKDFLSIWASEARSSSCPHYAVLDF